MAAAPPSGHTASVGLNKAAPWHGSRVVHGPRLTRSGEPPTGGGERRGEPVHIAGRLLTVAALLAARLLEAHGDAIPVHALKRQGLQNEHVRRPVHQIAPLVRDRPLPPDCQGEGKEPQERKNVCPFELMTKWARGMAESL